MRLCSPMLLWVHHIGVYRSKERSRKATSLDKNGVTTPIYLPCAVECRSTKRDLFMRSGLSREFIRTIPRGELHVFAVDSNLTKTRGRSSQSRTRTREISIDFLREKMNTFSRDIVSVSKREKKSIRARDPKSIRRKSFRGIFDSKDAGYVFTLTLFCIIFCLLFLFYFLFSFLFYLLFSFLFYFSLISSFFLFSFSFSCSFLSFTPFVVFFLLLSLFLFFSLLFCCCQFSFSFTFSVFFFAPFSLSIFLSFPFFKVHAITVKSRRRIRSWPAHAIPRVTH